MILSQFLGFAPKLLNLTLPLCRSQPDSKPHQLVPQLSITQPRSPRCESSPSAAPGFPLCLFSLGFGDKLPNKGSVFNHLALSASIQRHSPSTQQGLEDALRENRTTDTQTSHSLTCKLAPQAVVRLWRVPVPLGNCF